MKQKYHEVAAKFAEDYPIGSKLTWEQFSNWCIRENMMPIESLPISDPIFLPRIQREKARDAMNIAASNRIMRDTGRSYRIVIMDSGILEVQPIEDLILMTDFRQVIYKAKLEVKKLAELIDSANFEGMPAEEREAIGHYIASTDDVDMLKVTLENISKRLSRSRSMIKALTGQDGRNETN